MSLQPYALTTVAAARKFIGQEVDAELLESLIDAYSLAIMRYTDREFMPKAPLDDEDPPVTRRFAYDGSGVLAFSPYELRPADLGDIVLYSDDLVVGWEVLEPGSPTVTSDYRLEPRNATNEGTYLWMRLPQLGTGMYRAERGVYRYGTEVSITGRWGAGVVPADVELACKRAVADGFRNPEGFAARALGDFAISEATDDNIGGSLPLPSRRLLYPYRHWVPTAA